MSNRQRNHKRNKHVIHYWWRGDIEDEKYWSFPTQEAAWAHVLGQVRRRIGWFKDEETTLNHGPTIVDWDKFKEVMEVSQRSSKAWLRAISCMGAEPSPFSGFDVFNTMAVATVGRGTKEAAEAFEDLAEEYEEAIRNGVSTFKGEEKYRILFEGV
jgi:hypothetical protein